MPYEIQNNQIVFVRSEGKPSVEQICNTSDRLALCYDRETGILHKHGEFSLVSAWRSNARSLFESNGFFGIAEDLDLVQVQINQQNIDILNTILEYTDIRGKLKNLDFSEPKKKNRMRV